MHGMRKCRRKPSETGLHYHRSCPHERRARIRNMRLTVRRIVELAAIYLNREELRREYPELEDEDIRQALLYAATSLDDHIVDLPSH